MGLSILDSEHITSARVGSYSGVHILRYNLIQWALAYLRALSTLANPTEDTDDKNEDEEEDYDGVVKDTIKTLESWIAQSTRETLLESDNIDYRKIPSDTDEGLCHCKLAGVQHFVNSSDCDGVWSHGECCDILQMLETLWDTIDADSKEHWQNLRRVFQTAVDNKGYVIKC